MPTKRFSSAQEVLAEFRKRNLPEKFCHVPFSTLILEPDGLVGSCRHKGCEFPVGKITEQSLEEIWNSPAIRQWRREFLAGDPKICETEVRHRACHACPSFNTILPDVTLSEVQDKPPIRLGLNFNGQCNLQCQMCHVWQKPNGLYDQIGFWPKLEKLLPGLKEIELLSGEPFLQRDTFRLLELAGRLNPECTWTITTNGHWKLTDSVKDALDKVRFRNLIVSVDSLIPEIYAKIRRGGNLEIVLRNLENLLEYERLREERGLGRLHIRANFLIQKDNWKELESIHGFGKNKRLEVFRTFLYEPAEFSLLSLPEQERDAILNHYFAHLTAEQLAHSMRVILPLMDSLPQISRAAYLLKIREANLARML